MIKKNAAHGKLLLEIPLIFKDTCVQIREANLLLSASSLAYTTILSIIPLLAVSFAIFKTFGGMDKLYGIIEPFVISNLAEGTGEEAMQSIRGFIGNIQVKTIGASGLLALIVTCVSMLNSAENAINRVWKAQISRPFFLRVAVYWLFITLGPVAFSVAFAAVTSREMRAVPLVPPGAGGWLLCVAVLTGVYKWTPHRHVHWVSAVVPAIFTSIFLLAARFGYSLYTTRVVTYHKIYGSLGAVPIFLVWIYVVWTLILGGAAFGAAVQKRLDLK